MRVANLLAAVLLSGAVAVTTPAAAENPTAPTLKSCNKEADAKGLTGKPRADFIKGCLAGKG